MFHSAFILLFRVFPSEAIFSLNHAMQNGFCSYVINLQCFTESFLTGTSIGHSRDTYVNVQTLYLWLSVLCLSATGGGAELKAGEMRLLQW